MSANPAGAAALHRLPAEHASPSLIALFMVAGAMAAVVAVELFASQPGAPPERSNRDSGGQGRVVVAEPKPSAPAAPSAPLPVEPPPVAAPPPPVVAPPAPKDCPPLFDVTFESNSGTPHVEPQPVADLAGWLARHPEAILVIDGHASSRGSASRNLELSRRRAAKVSLLFEEAGVPHERITRRAFGDYAPMVGAPEQSDINRRATLSVSGGPSCPSSTRAAGSEVPR